MNLEYFLVALGAALFVSVIWFLLYNTLRNKYIKLSTEYEKILNNVNIEVEQKTRILKNEMNSRSQEQIESAYHNGFNAGEARSQQVIEEWKKKFTLEVQPFKKVAEKNLGIKGLFNNKKYNVTIGHRMRLLCDDLPSAFVFEEVYEEFTTNSTEIENVDKKMMEMASVFLPGLKKFPFAVKVLGKIISTTLPAK